MAWLVRFFRLYHLKIKKAPLLSGARAGMKEGGLRSTGSRFHRSDHGSPEGIHHLELIKNSVRAAV